MRFCSLFFLLPTHVALVVFEKRVPPFFFIFKTKCNLQVERRQGRLLTGVAMKNLVLGYVCVCVCLYVCVCVCLLFCVMSNESKVCSLKC